MEGVSIIVCCFNSAQRLKETVRHFALQKVGNEVPWEIIIVNNNSTDNTADTALQEWRKYGIVDVPFSVVDEPMPGLTNARHRGIDVARFDYTIFCDDDNWLHEDYVRLAFEIMHGNPEIGLLGGQSIGVTDISFPTWFEEEKRLYAVGKQGSTSGDITVRGFVWGAGMVLRKNVLQKLREGGIESRLTDRAGGNLSSGGDSEISAWYVLSGYKLWYDERLLFSHFIPGERLTDDYFARLKLGLNESTFILSQYHRIIQFVNNRHFGSFDFVFGIYLWFRVQFLKLSKRTADYDYLLDLVQLYTRSMYVNSRELQLIYNHIAPIIKAKAR